MKNPASPIKLSCIDPDQMSLQSLRSLFCWTAYLLQERERATQTYDDDAVVLSEWLLNYCGLLGRTLVQTGFTYPLVSPFIFLISGNANNASQSKYKDLGVRRVRILQSIGYVSGAAGITSDHFYIPNAEQQKQQQQQQRFSEGETIEHPLRIGVDTTASLPSASVATKSVGVLIFGFNMLNIAFAVAALVVKVNDAQTLDVDGEDDAAEKVTYSTTKPYQ
uniref:Uncharacterized protein n=1 Tax=Glossina pallidipes TaxID=7398 RepID=A0A1A9Z4I8_GLOPL